MQGPGQDGWRKEGEKGPGGATPSGRGATPSGRGATPSGRDKTEAVGQVEEAPSCPPPDVPAGPLLTP